MAKGNTQQIQRARIGGAVHDVRSPQNVGAVLGLLCRQPFRQRVELAWLLLWGHRKVVKENQA